MQGEPEICRDFRKGVCFRVNCRYAHINADGTPGTPNDQPVCRDFENGRCFRSNCRFFHRSAPELLAANLANSKRQGEPSPHDLLDRFGPLGRNHPDFAAYQFGVGDLSPSGDYPRDARSLLARELAKRELAISNRMLELSLAERALLELSIRERRQALGRLEPGPYQGLTRRDSVPVPGFNDLSQLGVRPSPTLHETLNRTRSVPVQGFQDLRGLAPPRQVEVAPPPRLDRRSSVPAQGLEAEMQDGGGYGWQTPGGSERGEYSQGLGTPQGLGRSTSETVQHLQEMRRAADSLLLDLERARRKESLSMPGSPELVSGDRAPRLELDPRLLSRAGGRAPVLNTEQGPEASQPEVGIQDLERYGSLRSVQVSPDVLGQSQALQGLQKYASEPIRSSGSGVPGSETNGRPAQNTLEGRISPQGVDQASFQGEGSVHKAPENPSEESLRDFEGVTAPDSSMHGSDRVMSSEGGLLSPGDAEFEHKSKSLQASPETRPIGSGPSQGFPKVNQGSGQGFGREANGLTSQGPQGLNVSMGGIPNQELRRMGSGVPVQEGLVRSMGSIAHGQAVPEGLMRSMGSINPGQGLQRGGSGAFPQFGSDFSGPPLTRRPSGTPSGFLGREDGLSPQAGSSSGAANLFSPFSRDQGPWLSPEERKEMFRQEQSKMYDQDRSNLERALRGQQLGRQVSGGFEGGGLEGHGHEGRSTLDQELASRFAQAGHFRPEQGPYNQHPLDYARFPAHQQQQQQRQHAPQAQSQPQPPGRPQYAEPAPGPPTPPASGTVSPSPNDFQEYSPFGSQPSLFKENSGKSIW